MTDESRNQRWRNRSFGVVVVLAASMLLVAGCYSEGRLTSGQKRSGGLWGITVRSGAFGPEKPIPRRFTADGENVSPPLHWTSGPAGTREFLLVMEDVSVQGDHPPVHWVVYHLPPTTTSLPQGASASLPTQGINYRGAPGYTGPAASGGRPHKYYFQIFALSTVLDADPNAAPTQLFNDWEGFVLSKGQLVGTY